MKTKEVLGHAVIGYDIIGVTPAEMHEMSEARYKIMEVLLSHQDDKSKKKYLQDEELIKLCAILNTLCADAMYNLSSFAEEEERIRKHLQNKEEAPTVKDVDDIPEVLAKAYSSTPVENLR